MSLVFMCFSCYRSILKRLIAFFFRTKHYQLCDLYTISFSKDGNVSAGWLLNYCSSPLQLCFTVYSTIERYNYVNSVRNNYPISPEFTMWLYSA